MALLTLVPAWRWGRAPERISAATVFAALALESVRLIFPASSISTDGFRPDLALRDSLVLVSVGIVALRANRLYPLIMAGSALIAVLAHGMRWLGLFQGDFSYSVLTTAPGFVIVMAFWMGLIFHIRREKQLGPYPAWRALLSPQTIAARAEIG